MEILASASTSNARGFCRHAPPARLVFRYSETASGTYISSSISIEWAGQRSGMDGQIPPLVQPLMCCGNLNVVAMADFRFECP